MEAIQKIFTGRYIDLDKIVSIQDAQFIDRMGSGGWYVGFGIKCQLCENDIWYERELEFSEEHFNGDYVLVYNDNKEILAVANLQKQINEVIKMWKERKAHREKL